MMRRIFETCDKDKYRYAMTDTINKILSLKTFREMNLEVKESSGNIYITKGKAESYPAFVCSLASVVDYPIKTYIIGNKVGAWRINTESKELCRFDAPKRCSIFMTMMTLYMFDNVKIMMVHTDKSFVTFSDSFVEPSFFDDCKYITDFYYCNRIISLVKISDKNVEKSIKEQAYNRMIEISESVYSTPILALLERKGVDKDMISMNVGFDSRFSKNSDMVSILKIHRALKFVRIIKKLMYGEELEKTYFMGRWGVK